MVIYSSLFAVSVIIGNVYGLSSSKSPGDQFNLNNWKLTLPDSSASEKSPDDLESDYTSQYFYTASDGSMTFYVPGSGGITDTAKYPRSELRQLCNPDASNPDRYNWAVDSYNYVEGTYRIGDIDSSSRKVVIQQIHAYDDSPLVKIQYESGKIKALTKTDSSGDNDDTAWLGEIDDDEQFTLKTVVTKYGNLKLYFNGDLITSYYVGGYWSDKKNYFKAGAYIQSNSDSAYATIHMYSLSVYTGSSACTWSSSSFTDQSTTTSSNTTIVATAVSIVIVALISVAIVFGICYWKKKKNIAGKEEVKDIENDDTRNDSKGSDDTTPVVDIDGAGSDTPNTNSADTAGYDMDQIEIEVPVDANNQ